MTIVFYIPPVVIVLLGVVLLQMHGGFFWAGLMWAPAGWGFSALLEVGSLWLWFRPGPGVFRPWALLVTGLLLVGPLFSLGSPLLGELARLEPRARAAGQSMELERAVIAEGERDKVEYLRAAVEQERRGWQEHIDAADRRLEAARRRLADLIGKGVEREATRARSWERVLKIIVQLLAVVAFQALIVMSLLDISGRYHGAGAVQASVQEASQVWPGPAPPDDWEPVAAEPEIPPYIVDLKMRIKRAVAMPGVGSQAELARRLDPDNVSWAEKALSYVMRSEPGAVKIKEKAAGALSGMMNKFESGES